MTLGIIIVRGLLSIMFVSGIAAVNSGPLSPAENEELAKTCGMHLSMPSGGSGGYSIDGTEAKMANQTWLLTIRSKVGGVQFPKTAAFLISPRHIMTSAQVVLNEDMSWRFNNKSIDNCCSFLSRKHGSNNDVPIEALETLEIWDPVKRLDVKIVKGRMFYLCIQNEHESWTAMIMEISEVESTRKYPCYITKQYSDKYEWGHYVHSYGVGANGEMIHRKMKLHRIDPYDVWFYIKMSREGFRVTGVDRGGPLVRIEPDNSSGKALVIGMKQSDENDYNKGVYYFQLGYLEKEVCEFSGVCWPKPATTPTP